MTMLGASNDFGKDVWLPVMDGLNYQLENTPSTLMNLLPKSEVALEGRRQYVKLKIGDSLGGSTIVEGGDFATPGDPVWDEATLSLSRVNHVIEFTLDEWELLNSNMAAARPVVEEKMESAFDFVTRHVDRMAHMDGTGILANVASVSGQDVTLDATTTSVVDRDRYLWVDDAYRHRYDIVHGTTGAQQATGITISAIDESTNTITCVGDVSSANSAGVLVQSGDWASGGAFRSLEFPGVLAPVGSVSDTYLGLSRTTFPFWRPTLLTNSGATRNLTPALIHELRNKVARRRSGGGVQPSAADGYFYICSPGVWTAAHEIMAPGLRYTVDTRPDIGFPEFDLMGVPCYEDIHFSRNRLALFRGPSFEFLKAKHARFGLMSWMNLNGQREWLKNAASGGGYAAATQMIMTGMIGLYTPRPRDHGMLGDITEIASTY